MARSVSRFSVLTIAALVTSSLTGTSVHGQSLVPKPTPESHVLEAKRLLGDIAASPNTDIGKLIATLQIHFTDFASTFLTGGQSSGTSQTIGTSGSTPSAASDWRSKFVAVERDLTALIGSADPQSTSRGVASLDPTVRQQLQNVRKNLELFYAATPGKPGRGPKG